MKVVIKRIIKPGEDPCFKVLLNGDTKKVFSYKEGVPENDIYSESLNLKAAKAAADILEKNEPTFEEIIYESGSTTTPAASQAPTLLLNQTTWNDDEGDFPALKLFIK